MPIHVRIVFVPGLSTDSHTLAPLHWLSSQPSWLLCNMLTKACHTPVLQTHRTLFLPLSEAHQLSVCSSPSGFMPTVLVTIMAWLISYDCISWECMGQKERWMVLWKWKNALERLNYYKLLRNLFLQTRSEHTEWSQKKSSKKRKWYIMGEVYANQKMWQNPNCRKLSSSRILGNECTYIHVYILG